MGSASEGGSSFAVHREDWADPEVAAMVAPPVVVTAVPVERPLTEWRRGQLRRSRGNMPVGRHRRRAR